MQLPFGRLWTYPIVASRSRSGYEYRGHGPGIREMVRGVVDGRAEGLVLEFRQPDVTGV